MPELPEVETIVRDLRHAGLEGRRVDGVRVFWNGMLEGATGKDLAGLLNTKVIEKVGRRAKYIYLRLSSGLYIFIHLRMTGKLLYRTIPKDPADRHEHIELTLDNGKFLIYRDTRKFGRWKIVSDPQEVTAKLGPEPLDENFTLAQFKSRIKSKNRMLKPLLLDQTFLAGLGNIYVDEALWLAHLSPVMVSSSLTTAQIKRLFCAIRQALNTGLENMGTTLGNAKSNFASIDFKKGSNQNHLNVFRRTGLPCPECGGKISRMIVGQRSTHVCERCQKTDIEKYQKG